MNFKKNLIFSCTLSMFVSQGALARYVEVIGSQKHILKYTTPNSLNTTTNERPIQLLYLRLSDEAKDMLAERAQDAVAHKNYFMQPLTQSLVTKVNLGMNGVPVLNQGMHGACVTFAVSGAVDAILGKGNYVSQICPLQLGLYLAKEGLGLSSWDGGYASEVIKQMTNYGIINKDTQHSKSCGGYYHYPAHAKHPTSTTMDGVSYKNMSEPVFGTKVISTELPAPMEGNDPEQALALVKQALTEGDRVIFAFLLPRTDLGTMGSVGKHNTWFYKDTWVITPEIIDGISSTKSGHELIITGYDDNAVATDTKGVKHTGLLTVRNSWGWSVGYWGDFYMSYDYFKLLTYDMQRFSPVH